MGQYITFFIPLRLCYFCYDNHTAALFFYCSAINSGVLLSTLERCVFVFFLLFNVSFPLKNDFCCCFFLFFSARFLWHWNARECNSKHKFCALHRWLFCHSIHDCSNQAAASSRLNDMTDTFSCVRSPRASNLNQYFFFFFFCFALLCSSSWLLLHLK